MVAERVFRETDDKVAVRKEEKVLEMGNEEVTGAGVELDGGEGVVELEVEIACTPLLATIVRTRISSLSSAMELRDTEVLLIAITV